MMCSPCARTERANSASNSMSNRAPCAANRSRATNQFAARIATSIVQAQLTPKRGGLVAMKSSTWLRNSLTYVSGDRKPTASSFDRAYAQANCTRCCIRASSLGTLMSTPGRCPYGTSRCHAVPFHRYPDLKSRCQSMGI